MSAAPQPELPFKRLGEYEVLAPISEGGMASVWLGRAVAPPENLVALKVIRPEHGRNKEFVAMFLDEARIASRLSHPNIVAIHGLGLEGKRHFLAMEVLRGRTLLALWEAAQARKGRLPYEVLAWIGARVADALHHAHELRDERGTQRQVVHRDVNPSNIFVTTDGVPKLIDFGLAKARDRITSTAVGVVKGKLAYLAPEQAHGHPVDRRADVFALGITLWEISLDRRLFRDDSDVETVRRVREADVPDPTTLAEGYPRELADVIQRALAREPSARWQTAGELRDALDAFVRASGRTVDASTVRALVAELSAGQSAAPWERVADDAGEERVRVWDDDRQKLTWMHASIETAAPAARNGGATVLASAPPRTRRERLEQALDERFAALGTQAGPLATARAHLERALVAELLGDATTAAHHAQASLTASPTAIAHETLRRLRHARGAARALMAHVDEEIARSASDPGRADLLAERARLLQAAGEAPAAIRAAWERVLASAPGHPAALSGLESALGSDRRALASHLERMADAYTGEPRLAAWLHVERAGVLDRDLAQPDAARAALARALELDGGPGAVRAACVRHAALHRDATWLATLLSEEASLDPDPARAARLEVDAACITRHGLGNADGAVVLLERAAARVPIAPQVHRRALDELVTLHEAAGRRREALRMRQLRLVHFDDPRARAHELRVIAGLHESLDDPAAAVAALDRALELTPDDATLAEALDRLLQAGSLTERRAELWSRLAAAAPGGAVRAQRLVRAARHAETLGDGARAVDLLRAALVAHPADSEAVDRLLLLLAPRPSETAAEEVRARVAIHAHAADHATDPARRLAHLEIIALLQEERLADAGAAAATHEAILRLDPTRRTSMLGLARTAARGGDQAMLARALVAEAEAAADPASRNALSVRAAEALATSDPERALALTREVLARTPAHAEARALEQRLHETSERWTQVDAALAARIQHATEAHQQVDLWLARAELQRTRMRAPHDALASIRAALAVDPKHPGARDAWLAQLAATGDEKALREGLLGLAKGEASAGARARWQTLAAELDELVLRDDVGAADLYARALNETPGDVWLEERRARVVARSGRQEGAAPGEQNVADIEATLARDPTAPDALRALEHVARASGSPQQLASALAREADAFQADAPRLAALWALTALVQWKLPDDDDTALVQRILQRAPGDRAALDAAIRRAIPAARGGDAGARTRLVAALVARLAQAQDDTERVWAHLALALVLEPEEATHNDETTAALEHYREALRIDPRSAVAAAGAAHLAGALGDADAMVAAMLTQADLAAEPARRAALLAQVAGKLLGAQDPRLGARSERLARAGEILERALDADPEAVPAVSLLVAVRDEEGGRDRLLASLRGALARARSADAVALLGAEVARVASLDPADRVLAVDALRRVLVVRPGDAPTLRALADLCVAQGAWGEAVEALEGVAARAREPRTRIAALFELADLYARVLLRPADVERALRAALDVDPSSVEALRRLLAVRRDAGATEAEVGSLLGRLGEAEPAPEGRAEALGALAELRRSASDAPGAESALIEAAAQAPTAGRVARILELYAGSPGEQARVLSSVVARTQELERPDALSLTALGRLEVDALGRWPDGVAHLRLAVALAPGMHEARAALARGLLYGRGAADAVALLAPMLVPDAAPLLSLHDPAAALATLEAALAGEGRRDEAIVARELRAVAGGLDDGAHAELRARRLAAVDPSSAPVALDGATLRTSVVPQDAPLLMFDLAAALAGTEAKVARTDLDALGVVARDRLTTSAGHPLLPLVHRIASMVGIPRPDIVVTGGVRRARVAMQDAPWLIVPEGLLSRPESAQIATLMGPLVRIALGLSWLDELPADQVQAVLCGAARLVVAGYGPDVEDDEIVRRVGRAVGRKQKKALAELVPALSASIAPTLDDVASFEQAVARTELRAAFVATGDLLATLDVVRAADTELARATADVGARALGATLAHPLAGDVTRFALAPSTTTLRWRAGTLWGVSR